MIGFIKLLGVAALYLIDIQIKESKKPKKVERSTCAVTGENVSALVTIEHHVLHTVKYYAENHPGHLEKDFSEKAGIFIRNLRIIQDLIRDQAKTKSIYKVFVTYDGALKTSTSYTVLVKRVKDTTPILTATIDGLVNP